MKVLMLGNGFDLYHKLLTHYDDFMVICEHIRSKNHYFDEEKTIYEILSDLAEKNEAIREKLSIYEDAYKNTEVDKDEYISLITKLQTNCWFNHFLGIKNRKGWVDLEKQVVEVLNKFRQSNAGGLEKFWDAIKEKNDFSDSYMSHIKMYTPNIKQYLDYFEEQYDVFIEILKQYLKIFVDNSLPHISKEYSSLNRCFKNKDYVLTFNYTDTYAKFYDSNTDIIHVHGKLDNEIVLGVNSDKYDDVGVDDFKFIKYKKYYQRITKRTLDDLNPLFTHINSSKEQKSLFIVGHSLDTSDGDIITVIFNVFDVIIIYFHDDKSLDNYVKNLKLIFGSKELSKMTFSQKVIFRKLPKNEYLEVTKCPTSIS